MLKFFTIFLLISSLSAEPIKVFILAGQSNMQGQGVEEVREIGGLLIISVWFTILAYVKKRKIRT